jgi:anti-sigma factor RsiW
MQRAAHLTDELLSAYLDGELSERRAGTVEEHLEGCTPCRTRLDGMRRVVRSLSRLERVTPPPLLAQRVERRVMLLGPAPSLAERLEGRLRGLSLDSPMVVTFAVVLALAAIVYFFSHGVAGRRGDVSLQVAAPEAASGLMGALEAVEIEGRRLRRDGDTWVEEGGGEAAAEPVEPGSPRAAELLRRHPWIDDLLTVTGASRVRFVDDGGEVVLFPAAGESATRHGEKAPPSP